MAAGLTGAGAAAIQAGGGPAAAPAGGGPAASLDALRAEVLGTDLCTGCGACVGLCPYITAVDDHVAAAGSCRIVDGRCYRFCPRTCADSSAVDRVPAGAPPASAGSPVEEPALAGDAGFDGPIGRVTASYLARAAPPLPGAATDAPVGRGAGDAAPPHRLAQHGGTVSALVRLALAEGSARAAVVTEDVGAGRPRAVTATTPAEVDARRGSRFAVAPVAAEVNRVLAAGRSGLAVVALPCQATALARMRRAGAGVPVLPGGVAPAAGISLVIGLFCTWALSQEGWDRSLRPRLGEGPFRRVDIPPPPAEALVAEGVDGTRCEVPLAEVRKLVRPACRVCLDMTAENADLSVGMAETEPGWNTVLVRTAAGADLVARAVAAGALEVRATSAEGMAHLGAASLGKKRRAGAEAAARLAGAAPAGGTARPGEAGGGASGPVAAGGGGPAAARHGSAASTHLTRAASSPARWAGPEGAAS